MKDSQPGELQGNSNYQTERHCKNYRIKKLISVQIVDLRRNGLRLVVGR